MMPCFAVRPPIFNTRLRPRTWLPVTGTVQLAELLPHCALAFAHSTARVLQDEPRLWWASDEAERVEVHALLLQLGAVANDQDLVSGAQVYRLASSSFVWSYLV